MSKLNELLSSLDQVKKVGPANWKACCPAHDDRSPSMSIKETGEGAVLIHCFAGCSVADIVGAVGLEVSDLFPDTLRQGAHLVRGARKAFNARDAVEYMAKQSLFVAACCVVLREQGALPQADKDKLMDIAGRLQCIADEVL